MSAGSLSGAAPRRDLRTASRVVSAILMPIGPACVAVIRLVIPGGSGDVGAEVAANPGAQRLVLLLGIPALFTLLPGAYAALHLGRRHRPVLAAWAAVFLIPGYLGMTVLGAGDSAVLAGRNIGLAPSDITRLSEEILFLNMVPALVFVVGHIAGTVLLGVLAIRARLIPLWAAALLTVSQPLHLTAIVVVNAWLDLVAWGLTAVGMGFLGLRVLRTPNDEWELPSCTAAFADKK
ncbi:hypothetical protein IL992_18560 [Microbispora sp. NEAU-D428]|uniref:hypothetical protein n=1 Tax=Microbispora sitophila TaxID=2771537 RepID=UPI001868557C|nr:hypothetical protein [Microbispora sitophila]MBE3011180.1 hypothetical protein [Microbispora sitophila]